MTIVRVPGFAPSTHGFRFANDFPSEPDMVIPSWPVPIPIGDASNGLCGGMTYAVRDLFEAGIAVPDQRIHPVAGTPLYSYIVRRLFDSFDVPGGVVAYLGWQSPFTNQYEQTVQTQVARIRADIDAGTLSTLGLIRVRSFSPFDLGQNHQVLAYWYETSAGGTITFGLYDPNHPQDDGIVLKVGTANPSGPPEIEFLIGGGTPDADETTFGAFVTAYHHVDPSFVNQLQQNWRCCQRCQGLFFGGNPGSVCPAGGLHDGSSSADYTLIQNATPTPGQPNWRWCHKCQGLFFAGNPGPVCPAGGGHEAVASGNYCMLGHTGNNEGQVNWRWCRRCQGLWFAGHGSSLCPAGGGHVEDGSGDYLVPSDQVI